MCWWFRASLELAEMTTVISTSKYSTTLSSPRSVSLCALATLKNITKIIFHLNLVAVYKKVAKASHSPHPGVCVLDAGRVEKVAIREENWFKKFSCCACELMRNERESLALEDVLSALYLMIFMKFIFCNLISEGCSGKVLESTEDEKRNREDEETRGCCVRA